MKAQALRMVIGAASFATPARMVDKDWATLCACAACTV